MKENSDNIIYIPNEDSFVLQFSQLNNRGFQLLPENEFNQNDIQISNISVNPFMGLNINQTKQKLRKAKSLQIKKKPKQNSFKTSPKWRSSKCNIDIRNITFIENNYFFN